VCPRIGCVSEAGIIQVLNASCCSRQGISRAVSCPEDGCAGSVGCGLREPDGAVARKRPCACVRKGSRRGGESSRTAQTRARLDPPDATPRAAGAGAPGVEPSVTRAAAHLRLSMGLRTTSWREAAARAASGSRCGQLAARSHSHRQGRAVGVEVEPEPGAGAPEGGECEEGDLNPHGFYPTRPST
jgi:hypothetical protein